MTEMSGKGRKFFRPGRGESTAQFAQRIRSGLDGHTSEEDLEDLSNGSAASAGGQVVYSRQSDHTGEAFSCRESEDGSIEIVDEASRPGSRIGAAVGLEDAFRSHPALVTMYPDDVVVGDLPLASLPIQLPVGEMFLYLPFPGSWEITFNDVRTVVPDVCWGDATELWSYEAEWGGATMAVAGPYLFACIPDVETELVEIERPTNDAAYRRLAVETFAACENWASGYEIVITSDWLHPDDQELRAAKNGEYQALSLNGEYIVRDYNWGEAFRA